MLNVDFTPLTLMVSGVLFAAVAIVAATIVGRRLSRAGKDGRPQSGT